MRTSLLSDDITVIFAGTRGLGAAIARKFLEVGESIVIVGRQKNNFNKFAKSLPLEQSKKIKLFIEQDLDSKKSITRIINLLRERNLIPSTLIYNYGGTVETRNIHDNYKDWMLCIWRNVGFSTQMNSALMKERKLSSKLKKIIHISSASAKHLMGSQTYATSKALLNSYVITSGRNLARKGIVQMAISPGAIDTERGPWQSKSEEVKRDFLSHYQFSGKLGDETVIAELVYAMSKRAGDFCHGNIIECNGGGI